MVKSIGAVTLEMVSIATGEASLFLGQSLPSFLGSEASRVRGEENQLPEINETRGRHKEKPSNSQLATFRINYQINYHYYYH